MGMRSSYEISYVYGFLSYVNLLATGIYSNVYSFVMNIFEKS